MYEYHCSKCDKTFERLRKFSDPPLLIHEECGGAVQQLLSAPAFQLKGTGWYATDYKSSSKSETEKRAAGNKESSSNSSADGKSDAGKTEPSAN